MSWEGSEEGNESVCLSVCLSFSGHLESRAGKYLLEGGCPMEDSVP